MRHNKKFNHLGRTASHRNAMLSNMACSLIKHKRITTTVAKAKALKKFVEPLITRSKEDTTNSRRVVFSNLQDKFAVTELFKEISVKVADRPGGYTRIIKTGHRLGDNAEMCFIELVDYNENMAKTAAKKATRTRRSKKSAATAEEPVAEEFSAAEQVEPVHTVSEESVIAPVFVDNQGDIEEQSEQENEDVSSSDILENIASNLHVLNSQNPTKQYYMIYKLRYIDHMKNKDIAKNMNISEADVTSRLLELSDKLKKCFNQ